MLVINNPRKIVSKSFEIINSHLKGVKLSSSNKDIIKRVIHATADLNYAKDLVFSPSAVKAGLAAIRKGKNIVVDASMVKAGINKGMLAGFGGKVICLINDKDILRQSKNLKITRAILAMRKSKGAINGAIVAIGNAPTALFELCDLIANGKTKPALVVGVPVGFVRAKEAKARLRTFNIPYITNKSRKGGSSVAAAAVNALLKIGEKD
jgi:precorrin-8X/cobalt-precorrin-8 methylmutase